MADSVVAAHNLYQLSQENTSRTSVQFCLSGYTHHGDVEGYTGSNLISDIPEHLQLIQLADDEGEESGSLIISNCNSSLQLLASGTEPLIDPQLSRIINPSTTHLNTFLFVRSLADPPRIG